MRSRIRAGSGAFATALAVAAMAGQPAAAQTIDLPEVINIFDTPCIVSDGGRITAVTADPADFGGSASNTGTLRGHQLYVDHGPTTPFRFRSLTVTALACFEDGRFAEMTGTGIVDLPTGAQQAVRYYIRLFDGGEQPQFAPDAYRILLSNGYTSGDQLVEQGNIQILFR